jgi:predicted unusual protein kinase regulating ubiquinone biosynthesis (AarF/ABC1/UbiB family)
MLRSRYRSILWFFGGILAGLIWWDIILPKIGLRRISSRTRPARLQAIAAAFRAQAVRMGGVMIKVGQFLSSRLDVLPREFTDQLSGLQDEVQPETFEDIRAVVEKEFGAELKDLFQDFDPTPLAAASIGQVHLASLRQTSNELFPRVVVKVQRPNIEAIVEVDLAALRIVSRWVDLYPPLRRRVNMPALMEEFSKSLYEEIDYLEEGKNAEKFAANFINQSEIRVPHVDWNHTTRRVLTLEHIQAIKITDYTEIEKAGISRSAVAERLFGTYLKQIFEDRFFHADPHPGNLFVLPSPSASDDSAWQLVFVDFGMVGRLTEKLLSGLREVLIAIGTQDAARLIRAYQQLEILLPGADTESIQKASAEAFSRFWGRTAPELATLGREEIGQFAHEFGEVLYDLPFQVPENFILLGRCVGILSGICSGLDQQFNIWQQVVPYTQKLVNTQSGGGLGLVLKELGDILRIAVTLPRRGDELITRLEQGKLSIQTPDVKIQISRIITSIHRLTSALIFAVFFVGGILLYLAGHLIPAILAGVASMVALLFSIAGR